jgi:hypothetical protein
MFILAGEEVLLFLKKSSKKTFIHAGAAVLGRRWWGGLSPEDKSFLRAFFQKSAAYFVSIAARFMPARSARVVN